jgi:type 1 glutamine amidotransferase
MKLLQSFSLFAVSLVAYLCGNAGMLTAAEPRVLVYTRNHTPDGKGYVHDNIATSVAMIRQLASTNGFLVEASDDPAAFTTENLKKYRALVFCNSNNEAFENDTQREAFKRFIQGGGGFVGIHSASGSERKWPYYWEVLGGKFRRHPPLQKFSIEVLDPKHPATAHLGATWQWEDEFYYLDNLNPRMHVLLAGDLASLKDPDKATYPGAVFGNRFPLAWCQEFDGGRQFYTALGHKIEYYSDPKFQRHVLGGIQWVLGKSSAP